MAEVPDSSTQYRVSSYCDAGHCVAVSVDHDEIRLRDTKDAHCATLRFSPPEWTIFIEQVKQGRYDYRPPGG